MPAAVVMAAAIGLCAQEEAGAEDHGDDEDAARGDAHPRERLKQAARLVLGGPGDRRDWRGHWFGRRIGIG